MTRLIAHRKTGRGALARVWRSRRVGFQGRARSLRATTAGKIVYMPRREKSTPNPATTPNWLKPRKWAMDNMKKTAAVVVPPVKTETPVVPAVVRKASRQGRPWTSSSR